MTTMSRQTRMGLSVGVAAASLAAVFAASRPEIIQAVTEKGVSIVTAPLRCLDIKAVPESNGRFVLRGPAGCQ